MCLQIYTKYIILLCLTYYFPMVNSITKEHINNMWTGIKPDYRDYILLDDLVSNFGYVDRDEFLLVMSHYGSKHQINKANYEYRMYFHHFAKAVIEGRIPRCSIKAMHEIFEKILPQDKNRGYIIREDLIRHYGTKMSKTNLETIMTEFGELEGDVVRLYLYKFKRAMNIGLLPEPT
ncbi:uncharacterized protein LOC126834887 [Adelges cooleyi]|uniref:uncharacterized protein LOC126834887 n=1 Tax=Adelges cooleyi TaxID=133065 RepID=UPI002180566E|nr:uncharacterized protein LOC126834887 [Adelges cooleyi]